MSDRHENWLAKTFGGFRTKNSGAHFTGQMDTRPYHDDPVPMAWDGKSTLGAGISVTREMWAKAIQQAGPGVEPALALRWYIGFTLEAALDLVVVDANFFASLLEELRESKEKQ